MNFLSENLTKFEADKCLLEIVKQYIDFRQKNSETSPWEILERILHLIWNASNRELEKEEIFLYVKLATFHFGQIPEPQCARLLGLWILLNVQTKLFFSYPEYLDEYRSTLEKYELIQFLYELDRTLRQINADSILSNILSQEQIENIRENVAISTNTDDFAEALINLDEVTKLVSEYYHSDSIKSAILSQEEFANLRDIVFKSMDTTDFTKALKNLNELIKLYPEDYRLYFLRAIVYENLSDFESAISDSEKVIELEPSFFHGYYLKGELYIGANKSAEKALELFNMCILLGYKPDARFYYNRGIALQELKSYKEAIKDYSKAIELDSNLTESFINRGNSKLSLDDVNGAVKDYLHVLKIEPSNKFASANLKMVIKILYNRAITFTSKGQYKNAIENYSRLLEIGSANKSILLNIGYAYIHIKSYDEAISNFEKCIALDDNYLDAYMGISLAFFAKGEVDNCDYYLSILKEKLGIKNIGIEIINELEKIGFVYPSATKDKLKNMLITLNS